MAAINPPVRSPLNHPEFAGLLREHQPFAQGSAAGAAESLNRWFDLLMLQSGIRCAPSVWLALSLVSSLTVGGMVFVLSEQAGAATAAAVVGLLLPVALAMLLRSRRRSRVLEQLPGMVEELARAARSGRNLESAFELVAGDTPAPLGEELRLSARRAEMGIDLASAVRDLPLRTGVSTLTIFSSAVAVHQDTGGDLITVLERLGGSIRDRLHFASRLKAATIASRMGATMMIVIPIGVMSFYVFRDPDYLTRLTTSFWGRLSLGLGLGLQVLGCSLVYRILKQSARF